jgi:hypothetical protein
VEPDAKMLRNKRFPDVIIEWAQFPDGEFTWELTFDVRRSYPYLYEVKFLNFEDEISLRGGDCNIPTSK